MGSSEAMGSSSKKSNLKNNICFVIKTEKNAT